MKNSTLKSFKAILEAKQLSDELMLAVKPNLDELPQDIREALLDCDRQMENLFKFTRKR